MSEKAVQDALENSLAKPVVYTLTCCTAIKDYNWWLKYGFAIPAMVLAVAGAVCMHSDDANIQDIGMMVKRQLDDATPFSAEELFTKDTMAVYDVSFRTPYVDVKRYSTVDFREQHRSAEWSSTWYNYHKRHFLPATTITYNMAVDYSMHEAQCHDMCHPNFHDKMPKGGLAVGETLTGLDGKSITNAGEEADEASMRASACYALIPGCYAYGPQTDTGSHMVKAHLLDLKISPECRTHITGRNDEHTVYSAIVARCKVAKAADVKAGADDDDAKTEVEKVEETLSGTKTCADYSPEKAKEWQTDNEEKTGKFNVGTKGGSSTTPSMSYQWAGVGLWVAIAAVCIVAGQMEPGKFRVFMLVVVAVMCFVQCVMFFQYNVQINQLTRINPAKDDAKHPNDELVVGEDGNRINHAKFAMDHCYGSYYANIFGFVKQPADEDEGPDQEDHFQWATKVSNVDDPDLDRSDLGDEHVYLKAPYRRAFRLGFRYYYTMFSGVFAVVFTMVSLLLIGIVIPFEKPTSYTAVGFGSSLF